jgi:hypothetical protein
VKVVAVATLAGISLNFGQLKITKTRIGSMEGYARYFPKGYDQPPGAESIPVPRVNEAIIFKDFFAAWLRMLPHPVLVDILHKFRVQLQHLMPNAIVQIGKFMWAIQLPMSSLNIMSYIIRTRRFTLRDVRLHSLHSLATGGGRRAKHTLAVRNK